MVEVSRREKEAGVFPDPDIDTYMKVSLSLNIYTIGVFMLLYDLEVYYALI